MLRQKYKGHKTNSEDLLEANSKYNYKHNPAANSEYNPEYKYEYNPKTLGEAWYDASSNSGDDANADAIYSHCQ